MFRGNDVNMYLIGNRYFLHIKVIYLCRTDHISEAKKHIMYSVFTMACVMFELKKTEVYQLPLTIISKFYLDAQAILILK